MKTTGRAAVYPGSFDPITLGHLDIIRRTSKLYDEITIVIAASPDKQALFSIEERIAMIQAEVADCKNCKVAAHPGLTVEYAKRIGAQVIIRGLRAVVDFEYEVSMANVNRKLAPEIETVLFLAGPEFDFISSRVVKEVARHRGSLEGLVSPAVAKAVQLKFA